MKEKTTDEKRSEEAFVRRVAEGLDRGAAELDPAVLRRLARARALALEEGERGSRRWRLASRAMAGLAAASAAGIALFVLYGGPVGVRGYDVVEDVELLASADPLDLLEEMDFYAWVAERGEREGGGDEG